ncbi:MAG: hypothetical protein ACI80V_000811 [Rhodothermales bacterium]
MPERRTYDYAIIRVVPKVERDEFINVGVILWCEDLGYAEARIELNEARVLSLDPDADLDSIRAHLAAIPAVCAGGESGGPLSKLSKRERFLMLAAPRSTMIQSSPLHTGLCTDPAATLEHLMDSMVRPGKPQTRD